MKRVFVISVILVVLMLGLQPASAQNIGFIWAKQAGGPYSDRMDVGNDIAIDSDGNLLVVGGYFAPADFDGITLPGLGSSGANVFVAKYNSDGNLIWIKNSQNTKSSVALGVAIDAQDNVIVTGYYDGTATFDSVTLPQYNGSDVFILKYDKNGTLLWAKAATGNYENYGWGVSVDGVGNIYIAGKFAHHNYGGYINFDGTILNTLGGNDVFVAKYSPDGTFLWAKQMGSSGNEGAYGIAVDEIGNAYVIGEYHAAGQYGAFTLPYFGGSGEEYGDVFIIKVDTYGNVLWAKQAGGVGRDKGKDIFIDSLGDIVVTGLFRYTAAFDENTFLTSFGGSDIFIAKYDTEGNLVWAQQAGGIEDGYESDAGYGIASDTMGNIFVTGNFRGTGYFGDIIIPREWDSDIFVSKLNSAGNFLWAVYAGATNDSIPYERTDLGHDVAIDEYGRIYVTGNFVDTGVFGDISLTSLGWGDMFVARLGPLNSPPVIGTISAPVDPIPVGAQIDVSATFSDPDVGDIHTALWEWGNNTNSSGTVNETDGVVTGFNTYQEPGVYTIKLRVTDSYGEFDEATYQYIVIYDPDGGFVTGGGWISSPAGAYTAAPNLEGKATFGFVSKYKKGAAVPTGSTEFQFQAGDLNFHSSAYDWLVVTGSNYARYKGNGTINGEGDYQFLIWAGDGTGAEGTDTFRIKIWYEVDGVETVVYDNGMDQEIGGGNIVVHTK